jgi:hypothetical protein
MPHGRQFARNPVNDRNGEYGAGHPDRVWDLVSAYGRTSTDCAGRARH